MLLSHARLIYQDKIVFTNLSLDLPNGQWTAILGPSGSGKTSILKLIARLPVGGIAEGDVNANPHDIAYMAQTDLLLPWLTVLDNTLIGSKLRHETITSHQKSHAIHILESVGLSDALHKKPSELSGGMRQRAALARTLCENRKIILMDEPFSSLDAITKYKLHDLFKTVLNNKTVLLITHDPYEALKLADTIFILSGHPACLHPVVPSDFNYDFIMEKLSCAAA